MVTVLMAILIFMGIGWQFAFEQWGYARANRQGYVLSYPVTMTTLYAIVSTNLDNSSSPVTPAAISCFHPGTSNVRIVSNVDGSPETLSIIIGK